MVHCNRCHKQYIGETKRRLKDRFNEHRRTVDKQTNRSKPTTVSEHFLSNDHNASDMLLIPLELIKSNRDSVRKAREAYLIDRGQTLEPLGLNRRDETVTTKTRNHPQRPTTIHNEPKTIHNDPQRTQNDPQRPTTIHNIHKIKKNKKIK